MMDVDVWESVAHPFIQGIMKCGDCTASCQILARYDQDEIYITHRFDGIDTSFSVKGFPGPNVDADRDAFIDSVVRAVETYIAPLHRVEAIPNWVGEAVG